MGIIFVAGVHGVGKTSCCRKAGNALSIPHFTASEIIKAEVVSAIDDVSKIVKDVANNQELLIRGVGRQMEIAGSGLLLDGHFTVIDATKEIVEIPIEVFQRLFLDAVVVYRDNSEAIHIRLTERDGMSCQVADIEAHQDAEYAHAHRVASFLQIPIICLKPFDSLGLEEFMQMTWKSASLTTSSPSP
jgi:adenylate kinase